MSVYLPLIPLRGLVLRPGLITPLVMGQVAAFAVELNLEDGLELLFVAQRDPEQEAPDPEDLFEVGCRGRLLRSATLPDGTARVLVEGVERVRLESVSGDALQGFYALPSPLPPSAEPDPVRLQALAGFLTDHLQKLLGEDLNRPAELVKRLQSEADLEALIWYALGATEPTIEVQQAVLAEPSLELRLDALALEAARAVERMNLSNRVQKAVQAAMDQGQREYFLREQLKAVQKELGEPDGLDDVDRLQARVDAAQLPDEALAEAQRELGRMRRMQPDAAEYNVARTWLEWIVSLPWHEMTEDQNDLRRAQATLDADHYGLEKVKDRIIEYLAVRQLKPDARGALLCFVGPPGVGKTSLGKSIARALGRSFQRVSLGGVKDESEVRGHRRTYIGALPGRILQAIRRSGTRNPVLLLDEIDKLASDTRGDPASALLEVLDPEQNANFTDHYLDVPFDLSQVMFVATANVADAIPPALRDRMEQIELPGYIEEVKIEIARRHLLPKVREGSGLAEGALKLPRDTVQALIQRYTRESGVRSLERELARLHRKAARRVVEGRRRGIRISPEQLGDWLGPPPFYQEPAEQADRPGVAIGLAWTPVGGEILFIEALRFDGGSGKLNLTGSLGDVMKESCQAALSLLRSRAHELGLSPADFTGWDYHVHVPSGAIPKDGPSAGITMMSALASLLTGRRVRPDLAMTGELTLRGKVLPVGGVKEKVLAARRAGCAEVILPRHNEHDLEDIPAALRRDMRFRFVDDVDAVLGTILEDVAR